MASSTKSKGRATGPRKHAYNAEAAREREMHLYRPYSGFAQSENFAQQSTGQHPDLPRDHVLTVFAQLASLRLDAKRALISLFDRSSQHVVAESTPRLRIRSPESDECPDCLWHGVHQVPRHTIPMSDLAMKTFTLEGTGSFMVPDLTKDVRFNNAPFVTGAPYHRFFISVPITTPDSYVIGSIAVLDDKPRDGLTTEQTQLLQDLSITLMDYLISQRAMREEHREEKMVKALGLFFRGKTNLSEGMDGDTELEEDKDAMELVNKKLEEVQLCDKHGSQDENRGGTAGSPSEVVTNEKQVQANGPTSRCLSPVRKFKNTKSRSEESQADKEENENRPVLTPTTEQLEKSIAPTRVQSVLNRACNLMEQALDVEGVMFVDASVYARRQMIGSDNHPGETISNTKQAGSANSSETEPKENPSLADDISGPKSLVLGYSTSSTSSRDKGQQGSHYVPLPGSFISQLIDRYPRGKIFHVEKDGSVALSYEGLADNVHESYFQRNEQAVKPGSPKEQDLQQESDEIRYFQKVLPDARCIAIYPVWDFQRSRWFTVSIVWANDPGRVLYEPKDLTYMAAFSNSVMAEVSRMDVEAADRAKGDFISSISHELRSPLHGVLGTVELLQETVTGFTQKRLVDTVYSCGRTLLETLNHLLDYAKINTLVGPSGGNGEGEIESDKAVARLNVPGMVQKENLSILVQEVVEGLLAGAEFYSRETDSVAEVQRHKSWSKSLQGEGDHGNIMTIVDIEFDENWDYRIYSGAWRRVVMNLFGNALKYTEAGFIRLYMKKDTLLVGEKETPAVRITISDSGRGMSQDFLLHHLYIPFLQEDTQSPGLGVGLHLVHQIVKSLQGKIEFKSELGRGTGVDVVLPVTEMAPSSSPDSLHAMKSRLRGKTVSFFTESSKRGELSIQPEDFDNIISSLSDMVRDWFGLQVLSSEELQNRPADFLIVTEHEYRKMAQDAADSDVRRYIESKRVYPLIVLSGQMSSWKVVKENNGDRVIFLSQPLSPKTLEIVFESCLDPRVIEEAIGPRSDGADTGDATRERSSQQPDPSPSQGIVAGSSKKVLLVEDNPINLKIIETCVKNTGLSYRTATNGLEAANLFKNERFGAVVMDISMPVMDGLSATREMRRFEMSNRLDPASIIILTAVITADKQQEATVSGVDQFLTKPTPLKQLSKLLQELPQLKS